MRRVASWLAIGSVASAVAVTFLTSVAHADTPTEQGWWTVTNAGAPTAGFTVPASPDVPPDGLLVQGGSDAGAPSAFAALVYDVPPDSTVGQLTLAVTPAHIYMLQEPALFPVPIWALWLRLPMQAALLWLILWSTQRPCSPNS